MTKLVPRTILAMILPAMAGFPAEKEWVNSIGMKLVRIEPGSFRMGQDRPQATLWSFTTCSEAPSEHSQIRL